MALPMPTSSNIKESEFNVSGGLVALLDDIATLAKAAAASLDDVAAGAAKASAKAAGVIIDDTAVTPQYVQGLSPARELPIIARIARGSLINKLAIILPAALLLSWLAPWLLPILLVLGGSFLCFEGAEKVLHRLHLLPHHQKTSDDAAAVASAAEVEKGIVASAVRTDLILSAEIMLIALADLANEAPMMRVAILVAVAFAMTFFVYGVVAVLVKMDDFGLHLIGRGGPRAALGQRIVHVMPKVFTTIGVIGTAAMLWVGGHIVIVSLSDLGFDWLHHVVEHAVHLVETGGTFISWLVESALSGVFGLLWGSVLATVVMYFSRIVPSVHRKA